MPPTPSRQRRWRRSASTSVCRSPQAISASASRTISSPRAISSDPACLVYTSGSTAHPKGVVSPHLQSLVMGRETANAFAISPRDRMYTCMPLFHGMAQVTTVITALYAGG